MIIFFVVVGEYAGDYWIYPKFPAAESSIHELRAFAITVSNGGLMQTLQKKEDTWCEKLWHYDAEYDSTRR